MTESSAAPILEVRDLRVSYGAIEALKGISVKLNAGEIVTLIGANGAGKSTTLRTIMGLVPPRRGDPRRQEAGVPAQTQCPRAGFRLA